MFFPFIVELFWRFVLGRADSGLSPSPSDETGEKQRMTDTVGDNDRDAEEWPNTLGFDVIREETEAIALTVTGHIPLYAAGTVFRNGPGARQLFDEQGNLKYSVSHWFDGFSQLHKFELLQGETGIDSVRYSSRFAVDSLMEAIKKTGSFDGYTFAQKRDPCISVFRKVMCLFQPIPPKTSTSSNVPVTISSNPVAFPQSALPIGHKTNNASFITARSDDNTLKAFDPATLEPIGIAEQSSLHPLLKGPLSASHAKSDPDTGDVFNYNLDMGKDAIYRVFKTSAGTGDTEILATISAPDLAPAYMHSFFLSGDYVVLSVWSAHLQAGGLRVLWEKNVLDSIAPFSEKRRTRWFVVDRRYGRGVVAQFESPASFCFHTINAYETKSENGGVNIVCDLIEYGNLDILHSFYYENLRSSSNAATPWIRKGHRFARYQLAIPLQQLATRSLSAKERESQCQLPTTQSAQLIAEIKGGAIGDMPNLNPRSVCRNYRYFWNGTVSSTHSFFDGLAKIDTMTGKAVRWNNARGHTPGEALFIPDPNATREDDGVLLTVVLDGFAGSSYLLCLDASSMVELGRADCKGPLPFMFHGQHVGVTGDRVVDV